MEDIGFLENCALEYSTLSQKAASILRREIIENRLPLDTRVTESWLAEKLGVSRVAIREAILMLIQEGLLVKEQNRYTKTVSFTPKDIEDLYEMREAIELAAAKKCIHTPFISIELSEHSRKIRTLLDSKPVDRLELVYADMGLHYHIIQASGNRWLIDAWNDISGPSLVLLYRYYLNCDQSDSDHWAELCDHSGILRGFQERDPNLLACEICNHIADTKTLLLKK